MELKQYIFLGLVFVGVIFAFWIGERIDEAMPPTDEEVLLSLQIEAKKLQIQKLSRELNKK